jgi:hypothetical protein
MGYKVATERRVDKYISKIKEKKLREQFIKLIFRTIPEDPFGVGELKVGDLSGVFVAEFTYARTEYKVAYLIREDMVIPILLAGPHENFYDQLKRLL